MKQDSNKTACALKTFLIAGVSLGAIALGSAGAMANEDINRFNIKAGDLKSALDIYIEQSGKQLIYRDDQVEGFATSGTTGALTNKQALLQVLAGSNLIVREDFSGAILVADGKSSFRAISFTSDEERESKLGVYEVGEEVESSDAANVPMLDEIIVTATRRSESLQNVAIAIQALSGKKLRELGIDSFDDYIAMLPGVSGDGQGPGKKETFIRGVTSGRGPVRLAGIAGEPSVATYLDETPISTPGRNIDLYATDLERIEVLKGPQGTLFGASSQAGTVRLITKKPKFNEFEVGGVMGIAFTRSGGTSNKIEAYVNIPFVDDKFAVRVAGYSSTDAGYIDNIFATTKLPLTNPGLFRDGPDDPERPSIIPSIRQEANNAAVVEDDFNVATYRGIRLSALWQFNDDWDLLLQHTNQQLDTEGSFEFNPELSTDDDLNIVTFLPTTGDDSVALTQWTLNGMLGGLEVIYNGSFTERTFEGRTAYTGYTEVGPFIPYYICTYPGYDECFSPVLASLEHFRSERLVQEVRFSTDSEKRLRAIGGVFYDDQKINFVTDFFYPGAVQAGLFPNFPIPSAFSNFPGVARAPGVTFVNDFQADREEISVFGEISYDLTDDITATFGARRYSIEIALKGQSSFGQRTPGPEADAGTNVDARLAGKTPVTLSDVIFKGNLTWRVTDDVMVYFTYSEGFRGGGFNRAAGAGADPEKGLPGVPASFKSDNVQNYEFGWKTMWLDNTLRFNGAIYSVDFTDLQQGVLDFSVTNSSFIDNIGGANIQGVEFEIEWVVTENVNLFGSFSYIDSELNDRPDTLVSAAPLGSALPFAPETEGLVGARYHTDIGDYTMFTQGIFTWTASRFNSLIEGNRVEMPGYRQVNLTAGFGTDQWQATVFVDNAFDTLGQVNAGALDNIFRIVPTRPRTIGFRLSFDY